MAVIKCKMCGGDLEIMSDSTVAVCEYCGTQQTVPTADNEKKLTLFGRANRLRFANEFDKAASVYESIVAEFPTEAEAYWGLVLCRYGIEYVDDPATGKKIPTCHRSSFESVMDDDDFEQACENADALARRVYREEAKAIEKLRKDILEVSGREEPYDIFICYKEKDDNGDRTIDSMIAQDVYNALTEKKYRVFFSRISLEDKLGTEYEPYIFAALNSAKVMLAFGTDYEHFNAVWVKNEWSRFLSLIKSGQKKTLIPCYKNIDAYDMPREFTRLQAQDMGKVGAIQDLLRGIEKIISRDDQSETTTQSQQQVIVQQSGPSIAPLLRRGNIALEDEDFDKAAQLFDDILNIEPECDEAYLGLLFADRKFPTWDKFESAFVSNEHDQFVNDRRYKRARQFAGQELVAKLDALEEEARQEAERRCQEAEREAERKRLEEEIRRKGLVLARKCIAAGLVHTVGLKSDGTVLATGKNDNGQCDVQNWCKIVAVAAGSRYTMGVMFDGTVVATGENDKGQCDVQGWRDIVAVATSRSHTVGLKSNGTVVATGENDKGQCDVQGWCDIVAVAACGGVFGGHTVGLKSDGTVLAVGYNSSGQCNVQDWRDIVAVAAGDHHTVGLKSDGTVVTTGWNYNGQCNVQSWCDIVVVAASGGLFDGYTVGLKSDGTVVATGKNDDGQCNVQGWRDIVAVAAGEDHTVGVKFDGTVVATGKDNYGRCNVKGWKLFDDIATLVQERK